MNHKELIAALAEASETDSKTATAMLTALTDLVLERVGSGGRGDHTEAGEVLTRRQSSASRTQPANWRAASYTCKTRSQDHANKGV